MQLSFFKVYLISINFIFIAFRCRYETINGLLAEEVGQFENPGLKNEGTRVQGFVQLSSRDEVIHRIDYNTFYKGDNAALRDPATKTPPAIAQLIAIMNSQR